MPGIKGIAETCFNFVSTVCGFFLIFAAYVLLIFVFIGKLLELPLYAIYETRNFCKGIVTFWRDLFGNILDFFCKFNSIILNALSPLWIWNWPVLNSAIKLISEYVINNSILGFFINVYNVLHNFFSPLFRYVWLNFRIFRRSNSETEGSSPQLFQKPVISDDIENPPVSFFSGKPTGGESGLRFQSNVEIKLQHSMEEKTFELERTISSAPGTSGLNMENINEEISTENCNTASEQNCNEQTLEEENDKVQNSLVESPVLTLSKNEFAESSNVIKEPIPYNIDQPSDSEKTSLGKESIHEIEISHTEYRPTSLPDKLTTGSLQDLHENFDIRRSSLPGSLEPQNIEDVSRNSSSSEVEDSDFIPELTESSETSNGESSQDESESGITTGQYSEIKYDEEEMEGAERTSSSISEKSGSSVDS